MGFLKKRHQKEKEENKKETEAFIKEVRELEGKYGLRISAKLTYQEQGIVPIPFIAKGTKIKEVKNKEDKDAKDKSAQ